MSKYHKQLIHYARWTLLSFLCGLLAGASSAVFLILLHWATTFRQENEIIIWLLPLAGLFIGWLYYRYGKEVEAGNNLILDEIHNPRTLIPLRMAPFVLIGTVLTHLFGGSAGREGTAVQMGASLSDQISSFFKVNAEERRILLCAGAGAGFGAAIGAPWAGAIFGMEVIHVGKLRLFAWLECGIASFIGYYTALLLQAPHTDYFNLSIPAFDLRTLFYVAVAGIIFGFAARAFSFLAHGVERIQKRLVNYPPLRPFLGGVILMMLFYVEGTYRYAGLGLEYIQEALHAPASYRDPLLKALFTSLTVGSGFKGGEFIPLVFIGTTLGSALSFILPISFKLLAALGFAAVFAGGANTPIACSLMAIELFGVDIAPYAFLACFMSYYFSGNHGIYKSQLIYVKKHHRFTNLFKSRGNKDC